MTPDECIEEIETALRDSIDAEDAEGDGDGTIDPEDAAEIRLETLQEIKALVEKYRVYGERSK